MKNYIKLMRVKHWLKNGLIFLPLFFSRNLFDLCGFSYSLLGFLAFSLVCSSVYIINDLNDIELDRKHSIKKNRPLASGKVSPLSAVVLMIILLLLSIVFDFYLYFQIHDIWIVVVPFIYLLINILYSFWLKHHPILDAVALVSGFLLRVIYGGLIVNVQVSNWLYLMIMFLSFYLCFGKRRNEMLKSGNDSRKVLQYYNKEFLDKSMYVFLSLALISYSLWCVDPIILDRIGNNLLIWSVPLVVIIFLRYSLNVEGNSHGDPIDVVTKDRELLLFVASYIVYMFLVIYVL